MIPKDFQKATADRILEVFKSGQNRILLADEVGLGKTIIASEVIKLVSKWHKEDGDKHFKVIYICSNINIANQNAKKLGIYDLMSVSESRLSMQHLKIYQEAGKGHGYEQLIPMTPATSFSMTSGCGSKQERALIFAHLSRQKCFDGRQEKLKKFLAYNVELYWEDYINNFKKQIEECDKNSTNYISDMDEEISKYFAEDKAFLQEILHILASNSPNKRSESKILINKLRKMFAQISLTKLEPDLVIMDEFQRFRDLIQADDSDSEQAMLTRQFLHNKDMKVLLLSATPYKPYSTLEEIADDEEMEHYREFMEVIKFLFYDEYKMGKFKNVWQMYSNSLCELSNGDFTLLVTHKTNAEDELYQGVCRTERMNNGIIDDSGASEINISSGDILSFLAIQSVLDEIVQKAKNKTIRYRNVPIDYVKSSPYLLSFMDRYQIKKQIVEYNKKDPLTSINKNTSKYLLIKKSAISKYKPIDSNNARLETLKQLVFENKSGLETLLWLPPSKRYYTANSNFEKPENPSKILVFSSWEMVPRMISVMLSYEAERLTIGKLFHNASSKRGRGYFSNKIEKRYGITRIKNDSENVLCHVCKELANLYKPTDHLGKDLKQIRKELTKTLQPKLDKIKERYKAKSGGVMSAKVIVELMKALDRGPCEIQSIPVNADEILVNLAIGSPAICGFRLFNKNRILAEKLAKEVFVSLFNKAESSAIIDLIYSKKNEDYYESVINYCVEGNLQAMLDEYAHVLGEKDQSLCSAIIESFTDTASLQIETNESFNGGEEKARLRTHFAVGYFNSRVSDEIVKRTDTIRKAFNSPFRPFVLATTSIGQEGLDFHNYCRKIVHWNLPSNPVDLEQREGRINRYKCLAVRQNIAHKYGMKKTWDEMFKEAQIKEKGSSSDLVPFWCLANNEESAVKIQRIVPMYPLSQDRLKYQRLINVLSLYRLTLGQPRQEELIEQLKNEVGDQVDKSLFINLSPFDKMNITK